MGHHDNYRNKNQFKRRFLPGTEGAMRKLVFILIAFIAAVTFIRAYDTAGSLGQDISEAAISLDVN
jgi:hypothetical protein